jgi:type I restriction enzyme R subunit
LIGQILRIPCSSALPKHNDFAKKETQSIEYLDESYLDSNQIYFVNQIIEYIVHNGLMKDLSVLQDVPFTDNGSIVEVFTDLSVWMGIKSIIDNINANAVAA